MNFVIQYYELTRACSLQGPAYVNYKKNATALYYFTLLFFTLSRLVHYLYYFITAHYKISSITPV